MSDLYPQTERTTATRTRQRMHYERDTVHAILDEFPLATTVDPRDYAKLFDVPTIVYKALGNVDEAGWNAWLDASRGLDFLSIVGRPAPGRYALPLSRAIRAAAAHGAGYTIGGVVIAERHTAERSGSARLLA